MNSWHNRLVITSEDHPKIIDDALHHSIGLWADIMPEDQLSHWTHKANDAWDALQGSFAITGGEVHEPEGEDTVLYMSPGELELALVGYGCDILDLNPGEAPEEITAINVLLKQIDQIKQ